MHPLGDGGGLRHEIPDALEHRLEVVLLGVPPLHDVEGRVQRRRAARGGAGRTAGSVGLERVDVDLVLRAVQRKQQRAAGAQSGLVRVLRADAAVEVVEQVALAVPDLNHLCASQAPAAGAHVTT